MSRDILEEAPAQSVSEFSDDPFNVGPQVPFVVFSAALACEAERLAGVSGKQGVDRAGEGLGVEGGDIIPDRGGGKVSGALCGDERPPWVFFPFDKAAGVEPRLCEHEAHIKSTGPGTK